MLVDANILLYAENRDTAQHEMARDWWDAQLSSAHRVCLCWEVVNAFVRISTSARIFPRPLSMTTALARVEAWLAQPNVQIITPTATHWDTLRVLINKGQVTGGLLTDAHLAALAICHGCTLYSADADFSRFPRLRWKNPLAG